MILELREIFSVTFRSEEELEAGVFLISQKLLKIKREIADIFLSDLDQNDEDTILKMRTIVILDIEQHILENMRAWDLLL